MLKLEKTKQKKLLKSPIYEVRLQDGEENTMLKSKLTQIKRALFQKNLLIPNIDLQLGKTFLNCMFGV